jgi:hypothetical protein
MFYEHCNVVVGSCIARVGQVLAARAAESKGQQMNILNEIR